MSESLDETDTQRLDRIDRVQAKEKTKSGFDRFISRLLILALMIGFGVVLSIIQARDERRPIINDQIKDMNGRITKLEQAVCMSDDRKTRLVLNCPAVRKRTAQAKKPSETPRGASAPQGAPAQEQPAQVAPTPSPASRTTRLATHAAAADPGHDKAPAPGKGSRGQVRGQSRGAQPSAQTSPAPILSARVCLPTPLVRCIGI